MIQAITLLVIAALVAIDQVIKIAVVNHFAAAAAWIFSSVLSVYAMLKNPARRSARCRIVDGFFCTIFYGCCL